MQCNQNSEMPYRVFFFYYFFIIIFFSIDEACKEGMVLPAPAVTEG